MKVLTTISGGCYEGSNAGFRFCNSLSIVNPTGTFDGSIFLNVIDILQNFVRASGLVWRSCRVVTNANTTSNGQESTHKHCSKASYQLADSSNQTQVTFGEFLAKVLHGFISLSQVNLPLCRHSWDSMLRNISSIPIQHKH